MKATLLGDIHGRDLEYRLDPLLKNSTTTKPVIQIGDFAIDEETFVPYLTTQKSELMIVGGNHDNYPVLKTLPAYLGDYGIVPGTQSTFFCRGAHSIDKKSRILGVSWWQEEELSPLEGCNMLDAYEAAKPEVMITHDCPMVIVGAMFGTNSIQSHTNRLFSECLRIHVPKIWIFGHWHRSKTYSWGQTCKFICLDIAETLEIDLP